MQKNGSQSSHMQETGMSFSLDGSTLNYRDTNRMVHSNEKLVLCFNASGSMSNSVRYNAIRFLRLGKIAF